MAALFSQILNMSMTASLVIAAVLVIRLILERSPKIYSYVLWLVVLFRLLCPVSFSAPVSVLNWLELDVTATSEWMNTVAFVPYVESTEREAAVPSDTFPGLTAPIMEEQEENPDLLEIGSWVWMVGCSGMILVGIYQYLRLKKRLVVCSPLRKNIYLADDIDSPFVMGILRPRVYLPTKIRAEERRYILAHERHHIRRSDHIIKLLAYLALSIHWFNPLVWVAFLYAGKDMEMSCDEAVIKRLGADIRAEYSATLLRMTTHRYSFAITPLAFGEGDTKGRIMNMAKWRKPKVWVSLLCMVLCAAVLAACALNPTKEPIETEQDTAVMFPEENTNILIVGFANEDADGAPDTFCVFSIDPDMRTVTMGTVLRDTVVSLPDYQNHVTGENQFFASYTLGKAWGGAEGAEEMVNQCLQDNFDIIVDHNMELKGAEFTGFTDVVNDIVGKLETPLSPELKAVSNRFLAMISGSDDVQTINHVKEQLAKAKWEYCTIPFEESDI